MNSAAGASRFKGRVAVRARHAPALRIIPLGVSQMPRIIVALVVVVVSAACWLAPGTTYAQEPVGPIPQNGAHAQEVSADTGGPCPCSGCGRCCRWWGGGENCPSCGMYQHMPYFTELDGYYYFHPYNASHLAAQQAFVAQWGGNPNHPYDNAIFERVYAEYKGENKPSAVPHRLTPLTPPPPAPRVVPNTP
jgi:hypothetical protein